MDREDEEGRLHRPRGARAAERAGGAAQARWLRDARPRHRAPRLRGPDALRARPRHLRDALSDARQADRAGAAAFGRRRRRGGILRGHPGQNGEGTGRRNPVLQEGQRGAGVNPEDLRYTASHEWVRIDGAIGTIGITDHAQKELGEIVYLELPELGQIYDAEAEFGTVESVKAVSELYTPVSGEVVEVNKSAVTEPGIVNDDPYGDGWLIKLKLSSDEEVGKLMSAEDYGEYVQSEEKAK